LDPPPGGIAYHRVEHLAERVLDSNRANYRFRIHAGDEKEVISAMQAGMVSRRPDHNHKRREEPPKLMISCRICAFN
jgi:hypothetical protein